MHAYVRVSRVYSTLAHLKREKQSGQVTVHRCLSYKAKSNKERERERKGEREGERDGVSKTCFYQFCRSLRYFGRRLLRHDQSRSSIVSLETENPISVLFFSSRTKIWRKILQSDKITHISFFCFEKGRKILSKNE